MLMFSSVIFGIFKHKKRGSTYRGIFKDGEVQTSRIGEKAIVPIHKGRSGGYTSTTSAGGSLNPADEQKVG